MGETTKTLKFSHDGHGRYYEPESGLFIRKAWDPQGWEVVDKGAVVGIRAKTLRAAIGVAEAYLADRLLADETRDRAERPIVIDLPPAGSHSMLIRIADLPPAADPATEDDTRELFDRVIRRAQYEALKAALVVLAGRVESVQQRNEAYGRPNDDVIFDVDDIRNMINDTARELGTAEPWKADQ